MCYLIIPTALRRWTIPLFQPESEIQRNLAAQDHVAGIKSWIEFFASIPYNEGCSGTNKNLQ